MPVNCPLYPHETFCDGCPNYDTVTDSCFWHWPPMPLSQILTTGERLARLEEIFKDLAAKIPSRSFRDMGRRINDNKGLILHVQQKLNDHIDATKPKKKKTPQKEPGVEIG